MKRIVSAVLAAVLLLGTSGCGSAPDGTKSTPPGQAQSIAQSMEPGIQPSLTSRSASSTAGYENFPQNSLEECYRSISGVSYLTVDDGNTRRFIYYAAKGSDEFVPLCGKPGCAHNSTECDAYITSDSFGFYDDKIFYVDDIAYDLQICRIELDGSGHRPINTVILEGCAYKYFFDNEYIYFSVNNDTGADELFRIKLEENAPAEHYNIDGIGDLTNRFMPVNGVVYLAAPSRDGVQTLYRCTVDAPPVIVNGSFRQSDNIKGFEFTENKVSFYRGGTDAVNGFYE